ncbi:MAG: SGNH/GDSL hydrolase family protein [Ruminococcaceae bacterium]|nr:SGNH/GDSL hydrolase family protein [Oscillospiraceae bacterium]
MILTNTQLQEIYFGAMRFADTEDGWLQAFQYPEARMEYFRRASDFWFERCDASTAKTIEFTTDARTFSVDYRIIWKGSEDSFELMLDGQICDIRYVRDLPDEGTLSFELPEGDKSVVLYLPADATVLLRNASIGGEYAPAKKGPRVLWMGDSITQGFGPLRSAHTYVSVANRLLGWDIVNQGIGGYVYDKNALERPEGFDPEKIVISMGTNQFGDEDMTGIEEYYALLHELYGDTPVLTITPIWRGDCPGGQPTLERFCRELKKICLRYDNITVVDGFSLVPHLSEYFLDNLHPNALGMEIYGRNLVLAIEKAGF